MLKRLFILTIFVVFAHTSYAQCILVKQTVQEGYVSGGGGVYGSLSKRPVRTVIDKPGNYCLARDFHIDGQYWPVTQEGSKLFSDDERILLFAASNITLDFKGKQVTSDAGLLSGLSILLPRDKLGWDLPTKQEDLPKNIKITNGYIRLERTGIAVNFREPTMYGDEGSDFYNYKPEEFSADRKLSVAAEFTGTPEEVANRLRETNEKIREINELRSSFRQAIPDSPGRYIKRDIQIDKMNVESKGTAMMIAGGNTVIKNSVIETDSGTAIWLHGPDAVIENNTIIVHCLLGNSALHDGLPTCKDMDAPIRLMHGDGAVIRNNRFILKDKAHQRVISVFETGAFTFENNTIVGLNDLKDTAKAYTGTLQMKSAGNRLVTSKAEALNLERMNPSNINAPESAWWSQIKSWLGL